MGKLIRIIILLAILAGVAFGVLLFNLNTIIKSGVETGGPMVINVPVFLDKSNIQLLSGKGELSGLVVKNPAGYESEYAFRLDNVMVDLDAKSVLMGDAIHIREIIIDGPHIIYDGGISHSNIKTIMDGLKGTEDTTTTEPPKEAEPAPKEGKDKKVVIDHLVLKNIKLGISNKLLKGNTINVSLPTIEQRDIGKDGDKSMEDVIIDILGSLNKSIIPAVQKGLVNVGSGLEKVGTALQDGAGGNEKVQKAADNVKKGLDKALDKVDGFFKR